MSSPTHEGTKMFQFFKKLQHVKAQIKAWNKHVFKNIFSKKEAVDKKISDLNDHIIYHGIDSNIYYKQKHLQGVWEELCKREEEYWWHKSHELWLKEGDKNTKFFHMLVKHKRAANTIFYIKYSINGRVILDVQGIHDEGVNFFRSLLSPPPPLLLKRRKVIF